ncbi:S41 family peptidase [Ferruginibacter sp. SUN106]|uniref:S41 family peptidase n=1 Tax=Ferruginibacter sp. SUN106 TaxID=2978348 RepID=UPI003D36AA68
MLLFVLGSCSVTKKNYTPNKKYPKQKLQQDFTLLKNILEKKHPSLYWYTSKDSMDMYFAQYYNAIEDSMTEQQFGWKIIAPLTDKIHCGHTSFGMSKAYNKWVSNKIIPSFPLFMKVWNDTMVVTGNMNRKDSVLKRGTLITGINGFNNATLAKTMFSYMTEDGNANNVNYLRLSNNFPYYHRNIFGLSKEYTVNYIDGAGNTQTIKVPLFDPPKDTSKRVRTTPLVKRSKEERKQQQLQNIRSLAIDTASNTAVITLNTFSTGKLRKFFRQTFRYIKKTGVTNTVLDIRSNGGGKINLSTLLTKYVTRQPFKVADSSYAIARSLHPYSKYIKNRFINNLGLVFLTHRKKDGRYHFGMWERKLYHPKHHNHFDGDLYVLINGQTFSASALFCNAIKGQPGIKIIGEEAGGGWYGNSGIMIPDITLPNTHLRVRLPLFRLVQYKHVPKDGHGVMPDIYIGTSYDALIKGYDKKLQVVMEMIRSKKELGVSN